MWSDEAYFYVDGSVYAKNSYIWSERNPKGFVTKPLQSEKVCVWIAFSEKIMVHTFILTCGKIDGKKYLEILEKKIKFLF